MAEAEAGVSSNAAPEVGWRRLIKRLGVDLRPGEGLPALLLFVCLFLLLTFQISTKTVRQSTFIDALGAARLPLVYLLVALVSYPILRVYNRFVDRYRVEQLLLMSCLFVAGLMVGFWALMRFPWAWVAVVFYVVSSIVYGMLTSQFWLFANHIFDPRQAKRLFGFIGAGALLGGVLGGQIARLASEAFGTGSVLLVAAGLMIAIALMMLRSKTSSSEEPARGKDGPSKFDKAKGGFEILRHSRPLRMIAAVVVLTIMVAQIVDLQFNWAVEKSVELSVAKNAHEATESLDRGTAFFGNFFSVMGIAAFIFQLLFTTRIHRTLGIGFALKVLPVTIAIGTLALFLATGFGPEMLIAAALILKVGESGLRFSLDQSTRELLFFPIPSHLRVRAKAFIDVFLQRAAKGLAALLLLPVTFGFMTAVEAGWISLVLIVIWLVAAGMAAREYVEAFRKSLKQRAVETAIPVDLTDVTTLELLLESLGSSDQRQVLHGLEILVNNGRADLVPPLLLYHDDAEVRRRTLLVLAEQGRMDVVPLIERRLGDGDPDVRAEAIRVLAGMQGQDVCDLMLPRLEDADPGVRAAAVACLSNHGDEERKGPARRVLAARMAEEEPSSRLEAAKAIGAVEEPQYQEILMQLLYDGDRSVVQEAISAVRRRVLRDGYNPLYLPTLISLLQRRRVKHEARETLVALGEPAIPALVHFMNDPDEPIWVRRALPKAIASIGTLAAFEALLDGLEKGADSFHRRKLVEALDTVKGRNVGFAVEPKKLESQIDFEVRCYLGHLAALQSLGLAAKGVVEGALVRWDKEQVPTLLDQLVQERSADNLRNIFGLLVLPLGADKVWPAYQSFISDQSMLRARALEFLDNTLSGELKRLVFGVIDDCSLADKLERAQRDFQIEVKPMPETLRGYLVPETNGDPDAGSLTAAALYHVHQEQVTGLEAEIKNLVERAEDPFVKETAVWIADRLQIA